MASPCFLLDEHISHAVAEGLRQREPKLQVMTLGQAGVPAISTPDHELLCWLEDHGCLIVTNNRSTMPIHLHDHLAAGRHVPGILIVPRRFSLRDTIDELFLIWGASLPGEYLDQIIYLPLRR